MAKFEPPTETWYTNQPGYHQKAFHLVLNKYEREDGLDTHRDESWTYDPKNPITSLSYLRGSILEITNSNKATSKKALCFQYPGDAIIMSGEFNKQFYHGVPAVKTWVTLFLSQNIVRDLTTDERNKAEEVLRNLQMNIRYNVTIRWHERQHPHCPYSHGTAA